MWAEGVVVWEGGEGVGHLMCLKWKAGGGVIVVIYLLIFLTVFYLFI